MILVIVLALYGVGYVMESMATAPVSAWASPCLSHQTGASCEDGGDGR